MISFFKKIVTLKITLAAKILLWRKKPEIIAITGSAGKTTTKELVVKLLSTEFDVLSSRDGFNTEIGTPLVLFDEKPPAKITSIRKWFKIILRCYKIALFEWDYPDKIVLEFGADAPGDIAYLCKTFKPHKGIILTVLPVHLELLKNIEAIAKEKGELAKGIRKDGCVFINSDNSYTKEMSAAKGVKRITFGKDGAADFVASNVKADISGLSFELKEGGQTIKIKTRLYGEQMIYPLLSAIAVARKDHLSYKKIQEVLKTVEPFKGRMNVLEGINGSVIIDDSYNANPESSIKALDFLSKQKGRRIALLGSMNELGDYEQEGHELVGDKVSISADLLITVGEAAERYLSVQAKRKGMNKECVYCFKTADDAGEYLEGILKEGDVLLAKGSQNNVRIERALEILIKDKDRKEELLVRQGDFWKNR